MSFAQKLKELRKSSGLSQKALARKIGKTARVISYYENEENGQALPKMEFVQLVAEAFDVPITYFDDNIQGKTKEDVLIEKLIDLSTDEKIVWNLMEDWAPDVYDFEYSSMIVEDVRRNYDCNIDEHNTYFFGKSGFFYTICLDVNHGYALYIHRIYCPTEYQSEIIVREKITNNLLARLYKIIESSGELTDVQFIDDAINNLNEPDTNLIDCDDVPF